MAMRKPEQKLWDSMKRNMNCIAPELDIERVENSAGTGGMPDVYCRSKFRECWIELKVFVLPKYPTTRALQPRSHSGTIRTSQLNWHRKHHELMLDSCYLFRDKNTKKLYLVQNRYLDGLDYTVSDFEKNFEITWRGLQIYLLGQS